MRTAEIEKIGIVIEKWIVKGFEDGALVYQIDFPSETEAKAAAKRFINR